jgi:hypothetical protein
LTKKHPEQFGEVGRLLLDYKQTQRRKHAYDPQQVDGDGKVRFGLKLNTETGRIASREHPKGGGGALADHPRDCRDMFLPDPGHLFLEVSLSHAAERIVCCLSGKAHLIDKAMTPTWEDEPVDLEDYERWIRQQVMTHRALANSWGRVISWPFDYLTPALYRRAYAWLPESEIAGLLATKGITPLAVYLKKHTQHHHIRLVCQVDDSLLISTPPLYAWVVYAFLRDVLAYPLPLRGGNLVIPVEATLGRTWQGEVVLTCPVGRDEFTALMETLL